MAALNNTRNLSRRKTLAVGAAGLAAGTILSLGLANAAPSGPDAELLQLYRERHKLQVQVDDAAIEADERESEAESKYPIPPEPFKSWMATKPEPNQLTCLYLNTEIERRARMPSWSPANITSLRQSYNQYRESFEAVRRETGAEAAEAHRWALFEQIDKFDRRILETPAQGPLGILVKLLVWHAINNDMDRTDWDATFVMGSILDLDRLTGGIIEMPSDVTPENITA